MSNVEMEPSKVAKSCISLCKMKVSTLDKICCFLAELIGTGLLVFLGCMGCVMTDKYSANSHLQMVLNFGLVVMVLVQCFGCVSGCHINPAVTLAALIYNLVTPAMAAVYFVAQMLGGFIGYGLLTTLIPEDTVKMVSKIKDEEQVKYLCVTKPGPDVLSLQATAIEFIITGVLILVCCAVWDPRNAKFHDSVTIRFGLTITCLACIGGPFTGGSMNPARSFAPALWNQDFEYLWIYWVGPLLGSATMAIIYKTVFRRELPETVSNNSKLRAMEEVPLS